MKKIGVFTAIMVAVANIVGIGIFTSLGYQITGTSNPFALLLLWIIGGIAALFGALSYGEVSNRLKVKSGGEYYFLSEIYHPLLGFVTGWISILAGFGATIAAVGIAMGEYTFDFYKNIFPHTQFTMHSFSFWVGVITIGVITLVNMWRYNFMKWFQIVSTLLKLFLIVILIIFGFFMATPQHISFLPNMDTFMDVFQSPYAISLIYVMFTYSGWECATYIAEEIDNAKIKLPKALFWATFIVLVLYVLTNFIFLYSTPMHLMNSQVDVAFIMSKYVFGPTIATWVSFLLMLSLFATLNSNMWAGSRVIQVMGEDYTIMKWVKAKEKLIPRMAVLFQMIVALFFFFTGTFNSIIVYVGLMLSLSQFLTVFGVFILRYKQKDMQYTGYKVPLYPFTPLIFLAIITWIIVFTVFNAPKESMEGLITLLIGAFFFWLDKKLLTQKQP